MRAVRQAIDEASTKAADSHIGRRVSPRHDRRGPRQTVKQTMIAEGDISRIAAAVAKKYPDVTAEQLEGVCARSGQGRQE